MRARTRRTRAAVAPALVLAFAFAAATARAAGEPGSCLPPVAPAAGLDVQVDGDAPGTLPSVRPDVAYTVDGALHVVWRDLRAGVWTVEYRRVDDFAGATSTPVERVSVPGASGVLLDASAPRLATDGHSTLYVVWHEFGEGTEDILFRARALSGGWDAPVRLNASIATHHAGEPQLAADAAGCVYVTWAQSDGVADQVYLAVSHDAGQTWTAPAALDDTVNVERGAHSADPRVACDGTGQLFVTYLDHRHAVEPGAPLLRETFLRRSSDGGLTFDLLGGGADELLLTPGSTIVAGRLVTDGAGLVVYAWLEALAGGNRVRVRASHSVDGGTTFAAPVAVGADGSPSMAFDLDLATLPGGDVVAVYGRADGYLQPTRVHACVFDTSVGAWGPESTLSPDGPHWGEHFSLPTLTRTRVAAGASHVFVVWAQSCTSHDALAGAYCGERTYTDVVASWSDDGGATWSGAWGVTTKRSPGDSRASFPALAVDGGRAAIVWDDRRAHAPPGRGAPDVYFNGIVLP